MNSLTTTAICWIALSYIIAIALPAEQLRRPRAEWEAAGRDRRFWVALTLVLGFHGLGQFAAAGYFVGVRPRLRAVERSRAPKPMLVGADVERRWQDGERDRVAGRWHRIAATSAAEELALLAALLVLASSLIHAVVIAVHFEQYWLFGVCFAVASVLQAIWTAKVYTGPLTRRLLLAGAIGNGALALAWLISRTVGAPLGPQAWQPEAVGAVDVLATLDELLAVVLVGVVLGCVRSRRRVISPVALRLVTSFAGVLFLYSVLSPFAGGHHH